MGQPKFALAAGKLGSKILRPLSGSFGVPATGTRGKQYRLGVEDWDLPAETKPSARRISLRRDQMLRYANYCLWRDGRKTGKDIVQRRQALRVGASPILNQIDGGAPCLGAKRGFDKGLDAVRHWRAPRKRHLTVAGVFTYVKVFLPTPEACFRCH
jgi:hypothetical protein